MLIFLLSIILFFTNFKKCFSIENNNKNNIYNYLINKKYYYAKKEIDKINKDNLSCEEIKKILIQDMFINYKLSNFELADKILNKILNTYYNDNNIDYILYMKGLVNLKLDEKNLFKSFNYKFFNKDVKNIYTSLSFFEKIVNNHKDSKYYNDSVIKILYIKQRLSLYYLNIIDFYCKKKMYISVINRSIKLIEFFPKEPYIYYAIKYIKKASNELSLDEIEEKVDIIIKKNLSNFNKFK